jgi:glycosyltransferase involved in cell wall biosynthesis
MNKELIIFNPSIEDGGVEKNLFLISNYFVNNKIKTSLISADINKKKKFDKKINFFYPSKINFINSNRYKKYFFCLIVLAKKIFLKKNILVFSFQANIYSIILCKLLRIKIIVRMNTAPQGWYHNIIKKKIYSYVIKKADGVIVNSKFFQKEVQKRFGIKSTFINNPFNFKNIKKLSNAKVKKFYKKKEIRLITIGRLTEQKDQITILKSMKLLNKKNFKFKLLIIGKGHLKNFLNEFVKKNNLTNKIKFLGYKTNPFPYIKQSKIFILSSLYEGSPNVLVEALFLKKIVISSNCPTGPNEILNNQKYGKLFNLRDYKDLTKKIIYLSKRKIEYKIPNNYFKAYDSEIICKKYKDFISSFLI